MSPETTDKLLAAGEWTQRAVSPLAPTMLLLAAASLAALLLRRSAGRTASEGGRSPWTLLVHGIGNVFHESAHALGTLLAGYRVERLRFLFNCDKPGLMGYCQPGPPWAFWANRPLLALLAAPAPIVLAALAFRGILSWAGVETDGAGGRPLPGDLADVLPFTGDVFAALATDLSRARPDAWGIAALCAFGFLVGAHALPSGADLRALVPVLFLPLVAGEALRAGADHGFPGFDLAWPAWQAGLDAALGAANDLLALGAVAGLAVWVVTLPIAWAAGRWRR